MYTVTVPQQCGCFKRSDFQASQSFESKDQALLEASALVQEMNETFCNKHLFSVLEDGEHFTISLAANV